MYKLIIGDLLSEQFEQESHCNSKISSWIKCGHKSPRRAIVFLNTHKIVLLAFDNYGADQDSIRESLIDFGLLVVRAFIFSVAEAETPDHFKFLLNLDGPVPLSMLHGLHLLRWLDFALLERLLTQANLIENLLVVKQENALTQSKQLLQEDLFLLIEEYLLNLYIRLSRVTF